MTVLIVDYGMGNIASARRALEVCGAKVIVSDNPACLDEADRLVIPGVGAFPQAMQRLEKGGWIEPIRHAALKDKIPVLGVCLGMQLLADESTEFGVTKGLGLVQGRVDRIVPEGSTERVPHVGWNEVYPVSSPPLFDGIPSGADFYFVHSYRFLPTNKEDIIAATPYAGETVSAVGNGAIWGVQFHPEKSSHTGLRLLRNFLSY